MSNRKIGLALKAAGRFFLLGTRPSAAQHVYLKKCGAAFKEGVRLTWKKAVTRMRWRLFSVRL